MNSCTDPSSATILPRTLQDVEKPLSLSYHTLTRSQLGDDTIHQCAKLFSSHYGIWSKTGHAPGQRVKLSFQKLNEEFLFDDSAYIVTATNLEDQQVIGHAIGKRFFYTELDGYVSWITQLVVQSEYRNKGVGTRLCQMAWDPKYNVACGLVTSHPYTVKALLTSTNCIIDKDKILLHGLQLIQASQIPYLQNAVTSFEESRCVVNTQFYVSHEKIDQIIRESDDWSLGELKEGEEFFVVCFPMNKRKCLSRITT